MRCTMYMRCISREQDHHLIIKTYTPRDPTTSVDINKLEDGLHIMLRKMQVPSNFETENLPLFMGKRTISYCA